MQAKPSAAAAIDHLVIAAADLATGTAMAEAVLGVPLAAGGAHPLMGTHNRLLRLGDVYLEVIAIDPAAPRPDRARWFGLDHFQGPPRLVTWVANSTDLEQTARGTALATAPVLELARGALRWRMAVPGDGTLPFGGCAPGLLQWQGVTPLDLLPDCGLRLERLELTHPDRAALRAALPSGLADPRLILQDGPEPELRATISTPSGLQVIG